MKWTARHYPNIRRVYPNLFVCVVTSSFRNDSKESLGPLLVQRGRQRATTQVTHEILWCVPIQKQICVILARITFIISLCSITLVASWFFFFSAGPKKRQKLSPWFLTIKKNDVEMMHINPILHASHQFVALVYVRRGSLFVWKR